MSSGEALIHIYDAPPRDGDRALCGHVRGELDAFRLHRSDNQCEVCAAIAGAEGRVLMMRPAYDPDRWVVEDPGAGS